MDRQTDLQACTWHGTGNVADRDTQRLSVRTQHLHYPSYNAWYSPYSHSCGEDRRGGVAARSLTPTARFGDSLTRIEVKAQS
jgi:hypothetical protein